MFEVLTKTWIANIYLNFDLMSVKHGTVYIWGFASELFPDRILFRNFGGALSNFVHSEMGADAALSTEGKQAKREEKT